jgi:DNA-binding GntR family transcriptional regulator
MVARTGDSASGLSALLQDAFGDPERFERSGHPEVDGGLEQGLPDLAVYAVRESLEGLVARTAALRRPRGLIDQLTEIHERMEQNLEADPRYMAELSFEFHAAMREAVGNPYLTRFLNHAEQVIRRFGRTTFAQPGRSRTALDEHLEIIHAIAAGDADLAERIATEHMRHAREIHVAELLAR